MSDDMSRRILTKNRMPDNHIPVQVEGGIAYFNGNYWVSSETVRVIQWPVEWWIPCDITRIGQFHIGQYTLTHCTMGGIYITRADGEGGKFATEVLEKAITEFYERNF